MSCIFTSCSVVPNIFTRCDFDGPLFSCVALFFSLSVQPVDHYSITYSGCRPRNASHTSWRSFTSSGHVGSHLPVLPTAATTTWLIAEVIFSSTLRRFTSRLRVFHTLSVPFVVYRYLAYRIRPKTSTFRLDTPLCQPKAPVSAVLYTTHSLYCYVAFCFLCRKYISFDLIEISERSMDLRRFRRTVDPPLVCNVANVYWWMTAREWTCTRTCRWNF